jgi:hypothetical protein
VRLYLEANFIYAATDPLDANFADSMSLLEMAEKKELEIAIPQMAIIEAQRGFSTKQLARLSKFDSVKTLVKNGQRVGITQAQQINIDEFDGKARALLLSLDRTQNLDRIQRSAVIFEPTSDFAATHTALTAALTTRFRSRPVSMEEMDRFIFAAIVNHFESHRPASQSVFCTLDKKMHEAAINALKVYHCELLLLPSFKQALKWARSIS